MKLSPTVVRRVVLLVFVLLGLGLGYLFGADPVGSWYARRYLRERYPWVHPSVLVFSRPFREVRLQEVAFERPGVRGTLKDVVVDVETKMVRVTGGKVDVDLDAITARQETGGTTSKLDQVTATGLIVHGKRGDIEGTAEEVQWVNNTLTVGEAEVTAHGWHVSLKGGSHTRGEGKVTVKELATTAPLSLLPVKIPGVEGPDVRLLAYDVSVTREEVDVVRLIVLPSTSPEPLLIVAAGHAVRHEEMEAVAFSAKMVSLRHPWLSVAPEDIEHVSGDLFPAQKQIKLYTPLRVTVSTADQSVAVSGSCQEWANVVAVETVLREIPFAGELNFKVGLKPDPYLLMDQPGYKATCAPTSCQAIQKLRQSSFTYTARKADGTPFERTTGKGTPEWIPIAGTGKMPQAVETLEDPGFEHHRGFIRQAYENSLKENVKTGKFTRGGSTLTMQLAKNLYLTRDKTFFRKAQEMFLAMISDFEKCLSKSEIMELYLNVVEFGPNVYGIGPGAHHWFKKAPAALTETEAFWMASILPAPRKAAPPGDMKGTERLMSNLAKQGKLPGFVGDIGDLDTGGWEATPLPLQVVVKQKWVIIPSSP